MDMLRMRWLSWLLVLVSLMFGLVFDDGAQERQMVAQKNVASQIEMEEDMPALLMDTPVAYEVMKLEAMPAGTDAYWAVQESVGDDYARLADPGFVSARTSPLSTFAADVDTAAYANVRRLILDQQAIPADAVRIEELINAFSASYRDLPPEGGDALRVGAEVSDCPWNTEHLLMRVNLKAREIETDALPPSNFVFLIDTSGSMNSASKLPLVQRSFSLLAEQLGEEDRVSIVTYAGSSQVVLEGVRGSETATILSAIADLFAGGSTHGAAGIETAYAIAEKYASPGVNSRVILATDGDFNVGAQSESALTHLVEAKRETGIYLTVMGFGYGNLKDNKLQALANNGNGNALYIDTIHEARKALVEELGATLVTVAKDVKLQVEFNPEQVEGYRLLGYENRRLQDEDFADDSKDGGEMGAGHSVTALYELIPASAGELGGRDLAYQQTISTGSEDFATVHVRFKQPDGDVSTERSYAVSKEAFRAEPSDDFVLSAAVAAFGQLLMGSEFAGTADAQMIQQMLKPMLSQDEGGQIVELSMLVRQSVGLY